MPIFPAAIWMSRAEKSLKIVTPNRCSAALAAGMSRPPWPSTKPISAS